MGSESEGTVSALLEAMVTLRSALARHVIPYLGMKRESSDELESVSGVDIAESSEVRGLSISGYVELKIRGRRDCQEALACSSDHPPTKRS